jgi:phosphoglycolate phosphatase
MTETGYKKLVLFDIDGTLLSSHGAGRRSITQALIDEMGTAGPIDTMRFDGKTDPQIVMELMRVVDHPRKDDLVAIKAVCDRYVELLEEELEGDDMEIEVLPGVVPLLNSLAGNNTVLIGLLTGNLSRGADLKLAASGLDRSAFQVGAFGSDEAERALLPAIATKRAAPIMNRVPTGDDVVIIGDTPADVTCGSSIGARPVGVATGGYSVADLEGAGAHRVFDDLVDTEAVVEAILE